jgi:hypothetical protein
LISTTSGRESPDVRPPRDTARFRRAHAEAHRAHQELLQEPDAEEEESGIFTIWVKKPSGPG